LANCRKAAKQGCSPKVKIDFLPHLKIIFILA